MASFGQRVVGAMKLQAATYEEVEHDSTATGQAAIIVVLVSLATAIGWSAPSGQMAIVRSLVGALIGWGLSAGLIWIIGTKLLPERNTEADLGQILRACGFAQAAGLFHVVAMVPILGWFASLFVIGIWVLVANVIAVRQALDYQGTLRAVAVCVLAWMVQVVLLMGFGGVHLLGL